MRGDNVKADLCIIGTMANNWFNYYFAVARLAISGVEIETVSNLGIFTDLEYHMLTGYNEEENEAAGFIKDGKSSGKADDYLTTVAADPVVVTMVGVDA